jgi:hypothetical protein
MDHLATELVHVPQSRRDIVHLEVRQGMRVAGSLAPLVHTERWGSARRLPALAFLARSVDEFDAEDSSPEAPGAIRIVRRKLDELHWQAHNHKIRLGHANWSMDNAGSALVELSWLNLEQV